jgi:hypothetical protein
MPEPLKHVIRNITFDPQSYMNLRQLQDRFNLMGNKANLSGTAIACINYVQDRPDILARVADYLPAKGPTDK